MNSQIVAVSNALRSKILFLLVTASIPISLFLKAGFISISVIWFFVLCLFNTSDSLKRSIKTHYILLFPIGLLGLHLLWILFSQDTQGAVAVVIKKIHFFLIPAGFIIIGRRITEKDLKTILTVFMVCCILCSIVSLIYATYNILHIGRDGAINYFSSYALTTPVTIEPIYLSMFCNLALLVTLQTDIVGHRSWKAAIACYLCVFIVLIYSKTGIICMIAIALIWFLNSPLRKWVYSIIGLVLLIAIISIARAPSYYKERFISSFQFSYPDSTTNLANNSADQLRIWAMALETIDQSILIGYGTGDGQSALETTYKENGFTQGIVDSLNPHNQFLSEFLDFGIFGGGILAVMLIIPLVNALRAKDILAAGFIFIAFSFFCIESVLERQKGIVFFSFFYSFLFCNYGMKAHKSNS